MTRLLWFTRSPSCPRSNRWLTSTDFIALPAQLRRNDVWGFQKESLPAVLGPYLQAVLATLAGGYRLSKRQVQQMAGDLFGLSIATGMVSNLERQSTTPLEAPYNEVALAVHDAEAAGIHDTSWRESPQGSVVGGPDRVDDGLRRRRQRSRAVVKGCWGASQRRWLPATDTTRSSGSIRRGDRSWSIGADFPAVIDVGAVGSYGRILFRLASGCFAVAPRPQWDH